MTNINELPSPAQRGQWIASLAVTGITGQQLAQLIAPNKTRGEIWEALREYARNAKK